jgi:hypothetical protein
MDDKFLVEPTRPPVLRVQLPADVWSHIFLHLSSRDNGNAALSCREFRWLAQRVMFSHLALTRYWYCSAEHTSIADSDHTREVTSRLNFFKSSRIAPMVRSCIISAPPDHWIRGHISVDAILQLLPTFFNLRSLTCIRMDFTPSRIAHFRNLPKLQSFSVYSCSLSISEISHLPLTKLRVHDNDAVWNVIDPRRVKFLSLGSSRDQTMLPPSHHAEQVMQRLNCLQIPCAATSDPSFITFLSNCPVLEHLLITEPQEYIFHSTHSHLRAPPTFPGLKAYSGPDTHLLICAQGRSLTTVNLWCGYNEAGSEPLVLTNILFELGKLTSCLKSLVIRPLYLTTPLLGIIGTSFPELSLLMVDAKALNPQGLLRISTREVLSLNMHAPAYLILFVHRNSLPAS